MKVQMVVAGGIHDGKVIEVEIVDVAPHLASLATFAVGPNPDGGRGWRLHNLETGLAVSRCDRPTKAATIAAAEYFLRRKTVQQVGKRFAQLGPAK